MAGHSKWANIKHRKGAQDKKRGKIFTKIIKEIHIAIKENGLNGDPDTNPALRSAMNNAKGANMPKDTIERAIKKATGADSENYELVTFEGYAPNGIAIFVEAQTDNQNRTVSNVRAIFNKGGGSLGVNGSVEFLFERKGVFVIDKSTLEQDVEELELELIDGGAESFDNDEELFTVYTEFENYGLMQEKLNDLGIEPKSTALERIPLNTMELDTDKGVQVLKLIDKFEEDDDVQDVYHNLEVTEEMMNELDE